MLCSNYEVVDELFLVLLANVDAGVGGVDAIVKGFVPERICE